MFKPEDYLNPDNFKTSSPDENDEVKNKEMFSFGFDLSNNNDVVGFLPRNILFATTKSKGDVYKYILGKDPCTASMLKGILAGSAKVEVYHYNNVKSTIKNKGEVFVFNLQDIKYVTKHNGIDILSGLLGSKRYFFFTKEGRERVFTNLDSIKNAIEGK